MNTATDAARTRRLNMLGDQALLCDFGWSDGRASSQLTLPEFDRCAGPLNDDSPTSNQVTSAADRDEKSKDTRNDDRP